MLNLNPTNPSKEGNTNSKDDTKVYIKDNDGETIPHPEEYCNYCKTLCYSAFIVLWQYLLLSQ